VSLTLNDIISFTFKEREKDKYSFDWLYDYPITVAYKDKDGVTVLSDITSICFNGKSFQLNEEEFDKEVNA